MFKKVMVIVWDYICDEDGVFLVVCMMGEIVGIIFIFIVGELFFFFNLGKGIMFGGIVGV